MERFVYMSIDSVLLLGNINLIECVGSIWCDIVDGFLCALQKSRTNPHTFTKTKFSLGVRKSSITSKKGFLHLCDRVPSPKTSNFKTFPICNNEEAGRNRRLRPKRTCFSSTENKPQ